MAHRRIPAAGCEVRPATTIAARSLEVDRSLEQLMENVLGQRLTGPDARRGTRA